MNIQLPYGVIYPLDYMITGYLAYSARKVFLVLKKISFLALIGYVGSAAVYLLLTLGQISPSDYIFNFLRRALLV